MSHPGVTGVVTVTDSAFASGWSTLGWVSAAAPVGPPLPDAGWPVSEGEVAGLVAAAVAADVTPIADARLSARLGATSLAAAYAPVLGLSTVGVDPDGRPFFDPAGSGAAVPQAATMAAVNAAYADKASAARPVTTPPRVPPAQTVIDTFQAGHTWTFTTADASSQVANTSSPPVGTQYVSMVSQGLTTASAARLTKTAAGPYNFTGKQFWMLCRINNVAALDKIQIYFGNAGFAAFYYFELDGYGSVQSGAWMLDNEWTWLPFSFVHNISTTGTPPLTAITDLRITCGDKGTNVAPGKVTLDVAYFGYAANTGRWPNGVVSFSCDDGRLEQFTLMRPILDAYGYTATAYVICDQVDGTGPATLGGQGAMSVAQLQQLQRANRWEIAAHASTSAIHDAVGGLRVLSSAQLDAEFQTQKDWFRDNGLDGRDHIAYPQGSFNSLVLARTKRAFASGRTAGTLGQEIHPAGDPMRLRAVSLSSGITLASVKAYVDRAYLNGGWLNIICHKLGPTADSLTWVTADYSALVAYIAAKPMPVATVGQVLAS